MKKLFFTFCIAVSGIAGAQMKEGKVIYERTMQMPVRMLVTNGSGDAPLPELPPTRTDQFELMFANNQSLWQFLPNANDENPGMQMSGGGEGRLVTRVGGLNDIVYHNFTTLTRTEQREVAGRNFLVEDSVRKLNWKLTDETKTILNYTARKATAQRIGTRPQVTMENGEMKRREVPDTANIAAWFTTDIPVPAGPGAEYQGQLPGLILEVDVNNGRNVIKAIEVNAKVNAKQIKEPKDGKKLTAAEFIKERDRLMEEMMQNMRGNIRIQQ
ncbi:MAG TPA: GLPGLI family protein [Flavisolibacter sp.]|jgi:GLPGLI family protein